MSLVRMKCMEGTEGLVKGNVYKVNKDELEVIEGTKYCKVYDKENSKYLGLFRFSRFEEYVKVQNVIIIEITSCVDCPESEVSRDPDPYDSFCDDDVKCICKLTGNVITSACRPYQLREETDIPDNCPKLREMN